MSAAPELAGLRVLLTGASRGIGMGIAVELARHGARIAGMATRLANLDAVATQVRAAGGEFLPLEGDVADSATAAAAVEAITAEWGGVDALVANAGITRDNLLVRMTEDQWDAVLGTNLTGPFHFVKAVARPMMKAKAGRIVLIGSVVATTGNPGQANYCAAKAGLEGMARSVASELGSRGITANVVAPGFIDTEMTAELPAAAREAMTTRIALGRAGSPADVAGAVRFLVGPAGAYVTGQVLLVDGGLSLG
ncbi:MAG TPA: 3-oxoacyl-ACP reductase FabG [Planctomycetota bacterium]